MQPMRRILCPTDFSATAFHSYALAERLAVNLNAECYLLHVSEGRPEFAIAGQPEPQDPEALDSLNAVPVNSPGLKVHRLLQFGSPGPVICWMAEQWQCDLIVIGTHGRRGLARLLMGSVAEYVVRHARCPVVTARLIPAEEPPLKEPVVLPVPAPRFM